MQSKTPYSGLSVISHKYGHMGKTPVRYRLTVVISTLRSIQIDWKWYNIVLPLNLFNIVVTKNGW